MGSMEEESIAFVCLMQTPACYFYYCFKIWGLKAREQTENQPYQHHLMSFATKTLELPSHFT